MSSSDLKLQTGRGPIGPPLVMGILNLTPDSFSDGGMWTDPDKAVLHAVRMVEDGAGIIDIGAESTRPGSEPVSTEEELRRLRPVVRRVVEAAGVPVSVDTMKPEVARFCLLEGASIVNDVNGFRNPSMAEVVADAGAYAVVMHSPVPALEAHGTVMGQGFAEEIRTFLDRRVRYLKDVGVLEDRIIVDPGIGFGKTAEQNRWILSHSSYFSCGRPVLSASSRKRFLRSAYPGRDIDDVSAEAALTAVRSGADIVRVHDVARTVRVLDVSRCNRLR